MYSAKPFPKEPKAGINIQYHQYAPSPDQPRARATSKNAVPTNIFLSACSRLASRTPRLRERCAALLSSATAAGCPLSACGTRLILAPHERQKLAPSIFWVAHLGQNISPSKLTMARSNRYSQMH